MGTLKLSEAELDLYQVNLAMRSAQLEARLLRNGLDFQGSARIGGGNVSAGGRLEWRDAQPYGKFKLQGENLRVVDVPEAADRCLARISTSASTVGASRSPAR